MTEPLNLDEFEAVARERLEKGIYGYYAGGADDEVTVRANREAFQRLCLRYRVLVDVSKIDPGTRILGLPLSFPVLLAPTALHRMAHPEGEKATARAAASVGTLMTLSTVSSVSLEEVAAAAPEGHRWFQLYQETDRSRTRRLVERAQAAGYKAVVLTVDAPLLGRRERDLRHPFVLPKGVRAAHFDAAPRSVSGGSPLSTFISQPGVTWKDLAWTRSFCSLPLLIKGVVRGDDAKRAVEEGIDGIWVSNHGGRQLDTAVTGIDALPEVVAAVGPHFEVLVDGGIRRGTDIVKALALGARAVLVGRPVLWGLAVAGQDGVEQVLAILKRELDNAMALCGCPSLADIGPDLIAR